MKNSSFLHDKDTHTFCDMKLEIYRTAYFAYECRYSLSEVFLAVFFFQRCTVLFIR